MMIKPKSIVGVAIGGDPGTGKDSTAQELVSTLPTLTSKPWKLFSVGTDIFRKMASDERMSVEDFNARRAADPTFHPNFDCEVDIASLKYCHENVAARNHFVTTSRLIPALLYCRYLYQVRNPERILPILFVCGDFDERIRRIIIREWKKTHGGVVPTEHQIRSKVSETEDLTREREIADAKRFNKIYGIPDVFSREFFGENVIDTAGMSQHDQTAATIRCIRDYL